MECIGIVSYFYFIVVFNRQLYGEPLKKNRKQKRNVLSNSCDVERETERKKGDRRGGRV